MRTGDNIYLQNARESSAKRGRLGRFALSGIPESLTVNVHESVIKIIFHHFFESDMYSYICAAHAYSLFLYFLISLFPHLPVFLLSTACSFRPVHVIDWQSKLRNAICARTGTSKGRHQKLAFCAYRSFCAQDIRYPQSQKCKISR